MNEETIIVCQSCKDPSSIREWNEATAVDCETSIANITPLQKSRRGGEFWYVCPSCYKEVDDLFPDCMREFIPTTNSEAKHLLQGG